MKSKYVFLAALIGLFAISGFGQKEEGGTNEQNAPVTLKAGETIKRGDALSGKAKRVSIEKVFNEPAKFADQKVAVSGVIVRSCKMEGCWAEIAPEKDSSKSVRVKMKDHAFFIPHIPPTGRSATAKYGPVSSGFGILGNIPRRRHKGEPGIT